MKKLLDCLVLCLFCLALSFSDVETRDVKLPIRMAVFHLEPFLLEGEQNQAPGGITVRYWQEYIAPRMGVALEVLGPFPIRRAERMLLNGEVDVVSQLTRIPEREELFIYPDSHLTKIYSCLVVPADSEITGFNDQSDLFGKRIVFIHSGFIPEILLHDNIEFDLVSSEDFRRIQLNMILAGRADVMLDINYISLLYYLSQRDLLDKVRIIMLPVEPVKVYSIFRDTPEGRALADQFHAINDRGLADNEFQKIQDEFLADF